MAAASLDALRARLQHAKAAHWDDTVVFLGDMVVALGKGQHWQDVEELGWALVRTNQHKRALHILEAHDLADANPPCRVLAATCMLALGLFQQCVKLMQRPLRDAKGSDVGALASSLALLRARACNALEHKDNACYWFRESLRADPTNQSALTALLDGFLLSPAQATLLVEELGFASGDQWLKTVYLAHIASAGQLPSAPALVDALQAQGVGEAVGVLECRANIALTHHADANKALAIARRIHSKDPYHCGALLTHIACLVRLGLKHDLHTLAHTLTQQRPGDAVAWFAVGSYYKLIGNLPRARQFLTKATSLHACFPHAWLSLAASCSEDQETDQAFVAYRTAARLFPSDPSAWIGMGKECLVARNIPLAEQYIAYACKIAPTDPLAVHEAGMVMFENQAYAKAVSCFESAVRLWEDRGDTDGWKEAALFNMGHALRKQGKYEQALGVYQRALAFNTRSASTHSAVGFTYHLMGQLDKAIDSYHRALSIRPADSFSSSLLDIALADMFGGDDAQ